VPGCRAKTVCVHSVVHEGEKFAGRGDPGDVAAPALGDTPVGGFDVAAGVVLRDGLDRGPAQQPRALFGDRAAVDLGVGLAVTGGHARPRTQPLGRGETADVANLGHEHRPERRADPVEGLDGPVAGIIDQPGRDAPIQAQHLGVIDRDQIA
jgi:hypothetical protein